jgi:hypothetical protein
VSASFKAIQLDPVSRQRTGLEHVLAADTRQTAIEALLGLLGASRESAQIDPSRTLLRVHDQLWTIIGITTPVPSDEPRGLRRAGAKHKRVR